MSDSSHWDDGQTLQEELNREAQALIHSANVYALITPDGLLHFAQGTREEVLAATDPAHNAAAGIKVVERLDGDPGIAGYLPSVGGHLPAEYPVNPVGRHVRTALAIGAGQIATGEELRGNLALYGIGGGLTRDQQKLIRVAHSAARDATSVMASYVIIGKQRVQAVYLPGLHRRGISSDAARQSADRLRDVAESADDRLSASQRWDRLSPLEQRERVQRATEHWEGARMDALIEVLRDLLQAVSRSEEHLELSVEATIAQLTTRANDAARQGQALQVYPVVELLRPAVNDRRRLEAAMGSLIDRVRDDPALATALVAALNVGVQAAAQVRPAAGGLR